jgi:glycosyltransferase involved in cell wall biosynthesis
VAELAEGLVRLGHVATVSYLQSRDGLSGCVVDTTECGGVRVHALQVPRGSWWPSGTSDGQRPSEESRAIFRRLVEQANPEIVHFHPLYLDDTVDFVEDAAKLSTVLSSYHTPPLTCGRGNLLRLGRDVCDGEMRVGRCTTCILHQKGLPLPVAGVIGRLPLGLCRSIRRLPAVKRNRRASSMFSWSQRVFRNEGFLSRTVAASTRIVAVCNWVRDLLLSNGVPPSKVEVIRYGRSVEPMRAAFSAGPVVRFGYLGRLNFEKGVGVLLKAIERTSPAARFNVEFVSPAFERALPGTDEAFLAQVIRKAASQDLRVIVGGYVPPFQVGEKLIQWDALIVPSLWLETGPQVVTEAFHVHTPVIGSRRGGLQELVIEGRSGFLFTPGDASELAALLNRFSGEPELLRRLRHLIPPARTADAMVEDLVALYRACS